MPPFQYWLIGCVPYGSLCGIASCWHGLQGILPGNSRALAGDAVFGGSTSPMLSLTGGVAITLARVFDTVR